MTTQRKNWIKVDTLIDLPATGVPAARSQWPCGARPKRTLVRGRASGTSVSI